MAKDISSRPTECRGLKRRAFNNQKNTLIYMLSFENRIQNWRYSLAERMEGNLQLKDCLADILKNNYNQNLLEEIESLQTRLICEDELIASIKSVINDLEKQIKSELQSDGRLSDAAKSKMIWIQRDITHSENRFCELKSAFTAFRLKAATKNNTKIV